MIAGFALEPGAVRKELLDGDLPVVVACRRGEVAFAGTESQRTSYRLLQGDVAVRHAILGRNIDLQRAAPGDWLIAPERRDAPPAVFAVCEADSVLLAVPSGALADALEREPDFARAWRLELETQFARLQRRVERLNLRTAERVAHYLATESSGGGELTLPFTKRIWAAQLGIAPETLSRTLGEMLANGKIEEVGRDGYRLLAWPEESALTPPGRMP